jgi:hypothetical protein
MLLLRLSERAQRRSWVCIIDKDGVIPYKRLLCRSLSGRNSAVECQLPKLDVVGSIPIARSKSFPQYSSHPYCSSSGLGFKSFLNRRVLFG